MEIPEVVGRVLEVCAADKTTVIWHFASGIIICVYFSYQELIVFQVTEQF